MKPILPLLALAGAAASASAQIVGVALGTAAPPTSFPVCSLIQFPLVSHYHAPYSPTIATETTPIGGVVGMNPMHGGARIGQGWAAWSHGYTGDIYWTQEATSSTYTMPAGTRGFILYAEPHPFAVFAITATGMSANGDTVAIAQDVDGNGGAKGFGFYSSVADIVRIDVSSSVDYAVGEFSICRARPACFADCTGDGKLTVSDFTCFQNAFALGDLDRADCTADGRLDIQDFTCFQNKFALACP